MFAKGGLFLIPSGMLNENHEPTRYYGVFRNHVETQIIPTTWREGGAMVEGRTQFGLRWDAGVSTGFNLSKWDPASDEGRESPLGSIHRNLLAAASDLAGFVTVNYTGVPGLLLGGSIFSNSAHDQSGFDDNRVTREGHARWTPGRWDFAALYARLHRQHCRHQRDIHQQPDVDSTKLLRLVHTSCISVVRTGYRIAVSVVRFNKSTRRPITPDRPGLTPEWRPIRTSSSAASVSFANGVVLKADYQHFDDDDCDNEPSNQFDLGIGYQF
jgi:hypothetical protein